MNKMRLWIKKLVVFAFFLPTVLMAQPYVTAHLMGQFGNQLFIMAAAISLALDHGADYTFPDLLSEQMDPVFKIPLNYEKVFYHLNAFKPPEPCDYLYLEPNFSYDPIPYQPNMRLLGWFQSEKYFANHKEEIIDLFSPPPAILEHLQKNYGDILQHPRTVAIHLRSYLKEPLEQRMAYAHLGADYVKKAMSLFPEDALFVVFSNDMEWCKEELSQLALSRSIRFIEGEPHYHDFYLMSLCKHNIICNSSFSWWAAYLNRNPEKIVAAPAAWFSETYIRDTRDLIPEEWVIVD
ncbi:alpha-1,2-fucosyltransferase [Candidatus Protochlamydia phocaeensis]|uniref:alpha-1,2-fucosyltransferase n=1 Tax=Candidatus Protochlamydia phocaeensis TaxID=1414722 RepID=UPI00083883CB|nr:alpha-1,2-fucosyltransferase [Candidatus Protochlamydia phocaeensis]